jgi:hypothetical protein
MEGYEAKTPASAITRRVGLLDASNNVSLKETRPRYLGLPCSITQCGVKNYGSFSSGDFKQECRGFPPLKVSSKNYNVFYDK